MIVTEAALREALGVSMSDERDAVLRDRGRFAWALEQAERCEWPSVEMLADVWRWALWLVMVRGYRAQTTGARYVEAPTRFGGWCAASEVDYTVVSLGELDRYTRWMYATARLSASSRAVAVSVLRSFYGWRSSRRGGVHCAHELRVPKVPRKMPKRYTQGQLKRLFEAVSKNPEESARIRDRAILLLLYASGIRREELCRLRLTDLQLQSQRVARLLVFGKGSKERIVTVEGPVVQALAEWLDFRRKNEKYATGETLFCNVRAGGATPLVPHALERIVRRNAERAGLKTWGVHMFRVTFATQLYDEGVDIERIRIALGHEHIETTRRYIVVANRQQSVRLPAHRQHSALGTLPVDLPIWAQHLEDQR